MDHLARLQLTGKITYYVGWIALLCGGLVHFNIARPLFAAIDLTQRNLFELSVVAFLICIASALRALVPAAGDVPAVAKRPVAA